MLVRHKLILNLENAHFLAMEKGYKFNPFYRDRKRAYFYNSNNAHIFGTSGKIYNCFSGTGMSEFEIGDVSKGKTDFYTQEIPLLKQIITKNFKLGSKKMGLEIINLYKSFRSGKNKTLIIEDVSFVVKRGEVLTLLGKNGSGKTTLIKMMSSLLKPCKGSITYLGNDIFKNENYIKNIGAVLEGNRNIYWYMTAKENFLYFGRLLGMMDKEILKKSDELLKFFDLSDVKDKKVGYFSRGMQQKVAIAIALLNNPKILFLDEPTLGLDIESKNNLIEKIKVLKKNGTIIILTTHQLDVANKIGDTLLLLNKGKIIVNDKINRIKEEYAKNRIKIKLKEGFKLEGEKYFSKYKEISDGEYIISGDLNTIIENKFLNKNLIEGVEKYRPDLEEVLTLIYKERT